MGDHNGWWAKRKWILNSFIILNYSLQIHMVRQVRLHFKFKLDPWKPYLLSANQTPLWRVINCVGGGWWWLEEDFFYLSLSLSLCKQWKTDSSFPVIPSCSQQLCVVTALSLQCNLLKLSTRAITAKSYCSSLSQPAVCCGRHHVQVLFKAPWRNSALHRSAAGLWCWRPWQVDWRPSGVERRVWWLSVCFRPRCHF